MPHSPKFWDKVAKKYSKQPIADEAAYQTKLEITREYFRPDSKVLELGCGTGSTAILHAPHVAHIHAVDISPAMLDIAEEKARAEGITNVTFEEADVSSFSAPDESYDAVLTLSLLHLLENKEETMANIRRMLKPGGVFVSSTVCLGEKKSILRLILPIGRMLGFFPLVKALKVAELERSITQAGFKIVHQWLPKRRKDDFKVVFIVAKK